MKKVLKKVFLMTVSALLIITGSIYAQEKVVVVGDPGGIGMGFDVTRKAFNKQHPEIKVELQTFPFGDLIKKYMLDNLSSAGEYDVVAVVNLWLGELASAGYLQPLGEGKFEIDMSKYVPGAKVSSYYKGDLYGLPYMPSGNTLLYYRTDLFEEAGLTAPVTLDDYLACAEKLTMDRDGDGKIDLYGTAFMGDRGNAFSPFMYFFGAEGAFGANVLFDENWIPVVARPKGVEALEMMMKFTKFAPPDIGAFTWQDGYTQFATGRLATVMMPADLVGIYEDPEKSEVVGKISICMPTRENKALQLALGGWTVGLTKWSKHKEAAFKYMKFHTGREMDKVLLLTTGCPPTIPETFKDPDVLKRYPYYDKFFEGIEKAIAIPLPIGAGTREFIGLLSAQVNAALTGIKTPKEAMEEAASKIYDALKEYGYYK